MKEITKIMINMWKMENVDWLGYELQKGDYFSYHHIKKREFGGKEIINNGAILCSNSSHQYIHLIENKDYEMYLYLTNILMNINNQREMPNKYQLLAIDNILKQFEKEHENDRSKKGKILIKEEYKRRVIL